MGKGMRERRFFPPLLKVSKEKSFVSIVCSLALYPAANSHEDLTHFHAQEIQLDNFRSILFVKFSPFLHFTVLRALRSKVQSRTLNI